MSSVSFPRRAARRTVRHALAAAALVALSSTGWAACSAPADRNACPLRVNGQVVFDRCFGAPPVGPDAGRPTDFGNAACNTLGQSQQIAEAIGRDNQRLLRQVETDMRAASRRLLDDAVDQQAVREFAQALAVGGEIQRTIDAAVKDPVCGSQAALEAIERRLREAGTHVVAAGEIAGQTLELTTRLAPVGAEVGKALAELSRLLDAANRKGPKAKAEFEALQRALNDMQREVLAMAGTDMKRVADAGAGLVSGVGPFMAACVGCAQTLSASIASLTGGGSVAVGGATVCPESAGAGCVVSAVSLPAGLGGAAAFQLLSQGACGAAMGQVAQLDQHLKQIADFVSALMRFAQAMPQSAQQALNAGQALGRLAAELGTESEASLRALQGHLNAVFRLFDATAQQFEERIAPRVQRLAGNFVETTARDTALLVRCHERLLQAAALIGEDLGKAVPQLVQATQEMVDAGKLAGNLAAMTDDGLRAAGRHAGEQWTALDAELRRISQRAWGVPFGTVDLPRTAAHLAGMNLERWGDIASDTRRLLERSGKAAADSVEAGKRAFLGQDRITTQAKAKYEQGQAKARAARVELVQARTKAEARIAALAAKPPAAQALRVPPALQPWPAAKVTRLNSLTVVK